MTITASGYESELFTFSRFYAHEVEPHKIDLPEDEIWKFMGTFYFVFLLRKRIKKLTFNDTSTYAQIYNYYLTKDEEFSFDEVADLASKWYILTETQMKRIWMEKYIIENTHVLVEKVHPGELIKYCKRIFDTKNIIYVEDTWKNKLATVIDPVQKLT